MNALRKRKWYHYENAFSCYAGLPGYAQDHCGYFLLHPGIFLPAVYHASADAGVLRGRCGACGIEIAYHVINFAAAVWIYREYLADAFLNVQINVKGFLKAVGTCVTLMVMLAWGMFRLFVSLGIEQLYVAAFGILPLAEVELFTLSSELVVLKPLLGPL